ncbi:lasso peptide biosynthesis B2 protein [Endomicrobium sp. AH-315-J14]|nr:lasso peptide biosynthesis B2 protein [Endomicrobium sp. AH-315-J14]
MLRSRVSRFIDTVASSRTEERRFAAMALVLAPAVELSLKFNGLRRTLAWIEEQPVGESAHRLSVTSGERSVGWAYRLYPWLGNSTGKCLSKALTQFWLHRRAGTPARFVVGVRKEGSTLDAHAWVEGIHAETVDPNFEPLLISEVAA